MNITLSADEKLIKKARDYANKHNTTLNALIRDFLKKTVNETETQNVAAEFEMIAIHYGGSYERPSSVKHKKSSARK
jgi:hypothetical protein